MLAVVLTRETESPLWQVNEELARLTDETTRLRQVLETALPPNPARVQENTAVLEQLAAQMGLSHGSCVRAPESPTDVEMELGSSPAPALAGLRGGAPAPEGAYTLGALQGMQARGTVSRLRGGGQVWSRGPAPAARLVAHGQPAAWLSLACVHARHTVLALLPRRGSGSSSVERDDAPR